jgi:Arc-like DNA binding domain
MKHLRWRQWLVVLTFVLVVSLTGLFAVRTVLRTIYWHRHHDEQIRPWMSIGYIAHSFRVPPWVLSQALGLPPKPDRRPIREIARAQHRSVNEVIAILQEAIVHARPPYPPPGPPPGSPDKEQPQGPSP